MIEVRVNNKPHQLSTDSSLKHLLQEIQLTERKGIAIAINEEVVPKDQWDALQLKQNDQVLIIKASQGG